MTDPFYPHYPQVGNGNGGSRGALPGHPEPSTLADVLERVLDRGIVIAGDIQVNLLNIELLTIKLRLLVASVDRAREMGINWWESDPSLSMGKPQGLEEEERTLAQRVERIESRLGLSDGRGGQQEQQNEITAERPRGLEPPAGRRDG
jgi:Gas vesicle protein